MKITCEHCRSTIDLEHDKKCPNCGASYSNNREYKKYKEVEDKRTEYEFREKDLNLESKQITNDMLRNSAKIGKKMMIIPFVSIIIFFAIIAVIIYSANKQMRGMDGDNPITVNFNETAETSKYDMKVDEITNVTDNKITTFIQQNEETTYYGFHVVFKNKTSDWQNLSNINCTYTDKNGNEDVKAHRLSLSTEMNGFTTEQVTYTGNVYCEIPNYATDVNVKYEQTKIVIKDFRELIK